MTDTVQNELLKECPFCGGLPALAKKYVYCTDCGAQGYYGDEIACGDTYPIEKWNTRTPAALPVGDEREAFEGALGKFDHPGHRVWMLMHPDDKPHLQIIMEHAHRIADATQVIRKLEDEVK